MTTDGDPVAEFQDAMARLGLAPRQPIRPDGKLHRFHVNGDRPGSKNGYCILYLDDRPAGAFGCWKRGIKETWKANGPPLSGVELAELMRKIEADRARHQREDAQRKQKVAETAVREWADYGPAPADHPYLVRKQIRPHGTRSDGRGGLVVPLSDADGALWSLQTIDEDGAKLFLPGSRKLGCMFILGKPRDRIVIAERFATGASIHEATGLCAAIALDDGNLEPVAQAIRAKHPKAQIS